MEVTSSIALFMNLQFTLVNKAMQTLGFWVKRAKFGAKFGGRGGFSGVVSPAGKKGSRPSRFDDPRAVAAGAPLDRPPLWKYT